MTGEELKQQIAKIENRNRAGDMAEAGSCPPLVEENHKPAVTKAMNLLLYQPRTEKELRDRLDRAGFEAEAVQCALEYVSFFGYLNDWTYAENYCLSQAGKKSRGMIRSELTRKGVGEGPIEAALELLETDEQELAMALLLKKYGEPHDTDEKELRRMFGFLSRKGFGSSVIWGCLHEYQKSGMCN